MFGIEHYTYNKVKNKSSLIFFISIHVHVIVKESSASQHCYSLVSMLLIKGHCYLCLHSTLRLILLFTFKQDSDLRSALLLEQAAHCFINMKGPMVRKFAFHMILAGHRFSKAGQVSIIFLCGKCAQYLILTLKNVLNVSLVWRKMPGF